MIRTVLLMLVLFPVFASAQPYLNTTSKWQFRGGASDFDGNLYYFDRLFYLDGDTIFNGQTYHRVYFDRQDTIRSIFTQTITGFDTVKHTYYAGIRESGQRFFMVLTYSTTETLIQDFDLQTGDTIQWDICSNPVTVSNIDTVYLGNTPLRRYFLNGFPNEYILEGIGCTDGFRIGCPGAIGFEYNLNPVCYSRDGYTIPVQLNATDCTFSSATKQPVAQNIRVYPNPAGDIVFLDLPQPLSATEIKVWNATGTLTNAGWREQGHSVDLSGLPKGIYFLAVQAERQLYRAVVVRGE